MIVVEQIEINGKEYIKTYSDANKMIEREGILYTEAIDPIGYDRTYVETDVEIEEDLEE